MVSHQVVIDLNDRGLFEPLGKEMRDYYRWFKANPPSPIPPSLAYHGAGTELTMPFMHLATCAPAYVIAGRYLKKFVEETGRNPKMLEVGCGTGLGAYYIKKHLVPEAEIYGMDFLPETIDYAREHYGSSGIKYLTDKAQTLPFENKQFDFVLSVHLLEHIPRDEVEEFVSETRRVLKRGGIKLALTPNRKLCQNLYTDNPSDNPDKRLIPSHEHEYYEDELRKLFGKFFDTTQINSQVNLVNKRLWVFGIDKLKPGGGAIGNLKRWLSNLTRGIVPLGLQNWLGRGSWEGIMRLQGISYETLAASSEYHHEREGIEADSLVVVARR